MVLTVVRSKVELMDQHFSKSQDDVEKSIKWILSLLEIHGFRIKLGNYQKSAGIPYKIYHCVLTVLSLFLACMTFRWLIVAIIEKYAGKPNVNFSTLFFSDHIVALLILVLNYSQVKNKQLILALQRVIKTAKFLDINSSHFGKSIWRIARFFTFAILTYSIMHLVPNFVYSYQIISENNKTILNRNADYYFGLNDSWFTRIGALGLEIAAGILINCMHFYIALTILTIYILTCCLKQLNVQYLKKPKNAEIHISSSCSQNHVSQFMKTGGR